MFNAAYKKFVEKLEEAETPLERRQRYRRKKMPCEHCGKAIQAYKRTQHLKYCSGIACAFRCAEGCDKKFRTEAARAQHHENSHLMPPVTCPYDGCGVMLKKRSYKSHIESIHKKIKIKCKYCDEEVVKNAMSVHYATCHIKQMVDPTKAPIKKPYAAYERKYKCSFKNCNAAFRTQSMTVRHEQGVHRREIEESVSLLKTCPICEKKVTAFDQHYARCSSDGTREFVCTFEGCSKNFSTKCNRDGHIYEVHKLKASIPCPAGCGKILKSNRVTAHVNQVHVEPFAMCNKCGREVRSSSLTGHQSKCQGLQNEKLLIKCPIEMCSNLMYASRLKDHMKFMHKQEMSECCKCLGSYLPEHLAVHSERCTVTRQRVTCHYCEKTMRKSHLLRHFEACSLARKDLGLKIDIVQCHYCKRLMRKKALLKHFTFCSKAEDWTRLLFQKRKRTSGPSKNSNNCGEKVGCNYCQKKMMKTSLLMHFSNCQEAKDSMTGPGKISFIRCGGCRWRMRKIVFVKHLEKCKGTREQAQCDFFGKRMQKINLPRNFKICDTKNVGNDSLEESGLPYSVQVD